jgi:flagellar biosynthetic protein FliR
MELMIEKLLGFAMVHTRISAFFLVAPIFSWKSIPMNIKVAMTLFLSIFFAMIVPLNIEPTKVTTIQAILMLCNEAIYGLGMGVITFLIFSVVKYCGRIIERQMGFTIASVLDPMTGENSQPLGMLLEMIFILIFLSVNGHHFFLLLISKSYYAFPAGTLPNIPIWTEAIIGAGSTLLMAGLRLAGPILAAFMLMLVVLAIMARIAPDTNILFISLPLRVGLGLIMTAIFIPFINGFVSEFADWMAKLLPI